MRELRSAPGFDEARAHDQRVDLLIAEHERRQVEFRMQAVTDTGFAVDRHAGSAEVGDVPVDGPLADFEPLSQLRGRRQPAAAQVLHDFEEPIRSPHGQRPFVLCWLVAPYCQLVAVWIEELKAPPAREAEDLA